MTGFIIVGWLALFCVSSVDSNSYHNRNLNLHQHKTSQIMFLTGCVGIMKFMCVGEGIIILHSNNGWKIHS